MEQEISAFIQEHKVATVCTTAGDEPYCFNCYYAFMEQEGYLIYKSSYGTRHEKMLEQNKKLAGTIIPEQIDLATIRGIQYEGILLDDSMELSMKASSAYYLKFPFAMMVPGKVYIIQLNRIKLTDNTRGFGFKQHWERT